MIEVYVENLDAEGGVTGETIVGRYTTDEEARLSIERCGNTKTRRVGWRRFRPARSPRPAYLTSADADFRERTMNEPKLAAVVYMLESQLHVGNLTVADVARCGVLAAQRYLERRNVPIFVHIVEGEENLFK